MSKVIVSVNFKIFDKGVSTAKRLGGKFDGTTKTWSIPSERIADAMGGDTANTVSEWLGYRGLIVKSPAAPVAAPVAAPTVRHDGGCEGHWGGVCECGAEDRKPAPKAAPVAAPKAAGYRCQGCGVTSSRNWCQVCDDNAMMVSLQPIPAVKRVSTKHVGIKIEFELDRRVAEAGFPAIISRHIIQDRIWDLVEAGNIQFSSAARQAEVEGLVNWYNQAIEDAEFAAQERELQERTQTAW